MHDQTIPTPSVSTAAAVCLAVSAVAAAVLAAFVVIDLATPLEPSRGMTGLSAAVCSVFGFGYISRTAEDRIGRRESVAVAAVLDRLDRVEAKVASRAPLDPDALRDQVELAVAEELGTRESVHAQGYAEGYVDGIDRHGKDPSAN